MKTYKKKDCEYCADEPDCKKVKHNMDCIFCDCQADYDTNWTCDYCRHDMARCVCPPEVVNKRINELLQEFGLV